MSEYISKIDFALNAVKYGCLKTNSTVAVLELIIKIC